MLSWSGIENGTPVDMGGLGEGRAPDHPWSAELHAFASAAVALDDDLLTRTRDSLVTVADVAGRDRRSGGGHELEMMTQLADGTGAGGCRTRRSTRGVP